MSAACAWGCREKGAPLSASSPWGSGKRADVTSSMSSFLPLPNPCTNKGPRSIPRRTPLLGSAGLQFLLLHGTHPAARPLRAGKWTLTPGSSQSPPGRDQGFNKCRARRTSDVRAAPGPETAPSCDEGTTARPEPTRGPCPHEKAGKPGKAAPWGEAECAPHPQPAPPARPGKHRQESARLLLHSGRGLSSLQARGRAPKSSTTEVFLKLPMENPKANPAHGCPNPAAPGEAAQAEGELEMRHKPDIPETQTRSHHHGMRTTSASTLPQG